MASACGLLRPLRIVLDHVCSEVVHLQGKVAILSHEVAELRDQAQCQGYRLVDVDAPLPPWVDKKGETDGTSNEVLGAVDRLTKIERDVAELTKVMEQYVKDQNASVTDASQERTELDCEEKMLNKTQSGTPLTEEIRESAVISVSVMDRSSSRKSIVKLMSSMTTITTVFYFDESVWSAAAWIGHLSFVESATVSVVLIVNVCVQLYFTILVVLNLGDYSDISLADNDLKGFLAWRVTSAHHVKNYDEITNTSLATRVCDHWPGIIASYDQMQHVKAFDSYTGDGSQFDLALGGPGLALLCVMCWICLVAKDVLDNLDFSIALLSNSGEDSVVHKSEDWSQCTFVSFSRLSVVCLHVSVVLPRLIIACTLFVAGARFLLFTVSLAELILNAIALGFILELDEMFVAFLPQRTRSALRGTAGLHMKLPGNRNIHWRPLLLVVVPFAGWLCHVFVVSDIIVRMQLAQDILCGGATHSVYAVDPATGVLTHAATSDLPAVAHDSYQFHAVLQFIKIEGSVQELSELTEIIGWEPDAEILSLVDDVDGVESIHKMNSAEAAAAVACHDLDLFYPYMASAQDYYRNDAVYNCSELKVSCEDSTFRLICPHTCQCDVMDSGMYLRTGCSSTCDDLILAEVTSVMDSLYGIGEDSEKCTHANTAWMIPFFEELEVAFFAQDLLQERGADYVWSSSFRVAFMEFANSEYALEDVTLSGWLDISVDNGLCDAIILIDNLMQTDLCHTSQLSYSLGTLQGVCPQVCGLCGTDGVTDTRLSVSRLYDKQLSMLSSGLLKFKLFDSITGSRLVCGSSVEGEKAGQASVTYSYEPSPNEVVVFSLCSDYTDFDTTISIYDVDDLLVAYNDDDDACGDYQSTVEYTGVDARVTIHVGSYFDDETGVFELAVTCYGAGDSNYSTTDSTTVSNINGPSNTVSSYTTSPSFNTDLVCGSSLQGAKTGHASVTYSYEPSRNEVVVFSLCSDYTDFDTTISIYDVDDLLVAYNDDDDACGYQSTVAYIGVDERVTIRVGSYDDDETGVFELTITCDDVGDGNYSTTNGTRSSNKTGQSFVNESSYDEWSSTVQSYEHVSWYGSGSS